MAKSHFLPLIVTVAVVVIAAEFFVNDYGEIAVNGSTDILGNALTETSHDWAKADLSSEQVEQAANILFQEQSGGSIDEELINVDAVTEDAVVDATPTTITFALTQLAGFENSTLRRSPFQGILFEQIDLRDFSSIPVARQDLLSNNKDVRASFYEFATSSEALADEVYALIQQKAVGGGTDVGINETNDYGDASFYVNYGDRQGTAFLVVKMRETVYALTYEKSLHVSIESLLNYLYL